MQCQRESCLLDSWEVSKARIIVCNLKDWPTFMWNRRPSVGGMFTILGLKGTWQNQWRIRAENTDFVVMTGEMVSQLPVFVVVPFIVWSFNIQNEFRHRAMLLISTGQMKPSATSDSWWLILEVVAKEIKKYMFCILWMELKVVYQSFEDECISRWLLMTPRVMQVSESVDGGNDEGTWYGKSQKLYNEVWENWRQVISRSLHSVYQLQGYNKLSALLISF